MIDDKNGGGRQCYFRCGVKECPPKEVLSKLRPGWQAGVKSQGKNVPDREKSSSKNLKVGMISVGSRGGDQGWRPGRHGWSELRTAVAGSEAGDAGRVLVIEGHEGHKDVFKFYHKSYGQPLEEFNLRNNIICFTFKTITQAAL